MGKTYKIKRGKDILLEGEALNTVHPTTQSATFAIKPTDFKGLTPKLNVKVGDEVKAGDCLFVDKSNPSICFTSPVSGEVAEIVRGNRRAIQEVKVLADSDISYKKFDTSAEAKEVLMASGLWAYITQRPFGIIADPTITPKAIHISGFDSSPLAADLAITLKGKEAQLQKGINVLAGLTDGKVHLNVHAKGDNAVYSSLSGIEKSTFSGPHPSGLVGVQIHHIDPINKGDVVWTIKPQHVAFIGELFTTGHLNLEQIIAVGGSEIKKPAYYSTRVGASLDTILADNLATDNVRVISGNVLTGTKIDPAGYLSFFDNQVSVIPEGNEYEMLGWLFPSYPRPTISSSLPISKFIKKRFKVNTNPHGELRAYVVTGEYEKVMPMDILPQQLVKAIMANDLELMENLGIYEVIEEDLALCEFVCTSKVNVQDIVKSGLELMLEES